MVLFCSGPRGSPLYRIEIRTGHRQNIVALEGAWGVEDVEGHWGMINSADVGCDTCRAVGVGCSLQQQLPRRFDCGNGFEASDRPAAFECAFLVLPLDEMRNEQQGLWMVVGGGRGAVVALWTAN